MTAQREKNAVQQSLFHKTETEVSNQIKNKVGRRTRKKIEDILPPSQVTLADIIEEKRVVEGVHDIAGVMFDAMYQSLFKSNRTYHLLRDVVLSRLVYPCSKRKLKKNWPNILIKTIHWK